MSREESVDESMSLSLSPWLKHTYAYIHTNTLAGSSVEDEVARR